MHTSWHFSALGRDGCSVQPHCSQPSKVYSRLRLDAVQGSGMKTCILALRPWRYWALLPAIDFARLYAAPVPPRGTKMLGDTHSSWAISCARGLNRSYTHVCLIMCNVCYFDKVSCCFFPPCLAGKKNTKIPCQWTGLCIFYKSQNSVLENDGTDHQVPEGQSLAETHCSACAVMNHSLARPVGERVMY